MVSGPLRLLEFHQRGAASPQVIAIRVNQRRAPTRVRIKLLGTSSSTYPMKKMPAPSPKVAELKLTRGQATRCQ